MVAPCGAFEYFDLTPSAYLNPRRGLGADYWRVGLRMQSGNNIGFEIRVGVFSRW
jgi:hypothetical protein